MCLNVSGHVHICTYVHRCVYHRRRCVYVREMYICGLMHAFMCVCRDICTYEFMDVYGIYCVLCLNLQVRIKACLYVCIFVCVAYTGQLMLPKTESGEERQDRYPNTLTRTQSGFSGISYINITEIIYSCISLHMTCSGI